MDQARDSERGSKGSGPRYQALDVWRGIVCVVVVLEHAGVALWHQDLWGSGPDRPIRSAIVTALTWNLGAPLFFVISGYCIASSLESTRRKGTPPALFIARRLWRIFPPYWASVAIIGGLVLLLDLVGLQWLHQTSVGLALTSPVDLERAQWFGNLTLTETWRTHFADGPVVLINRVAWALCYQEQFYLLCFLALVLAPRRLFPALGALTLGIMAYRIVAWDVGFFWKTEGFFPDLWHEFAVGLALYWRINVAKSATAKRSVELGLVALGVIGWHEGFVTTVAASTFGLILIGLYRWDVAISRMDWLDPVRACGRRSYAIYLVHLPVCTIGNTFLVWVGFATFWSRALVMIPIVVAASVAAGWAFHHGVDRRFGNLPSLPNLASRKFRTSPTSAPVPVPVPVMVESESPSAIFPRFSA